MTADQTPEALWKEIKKFLLDAAKDTAGYMQQQKRRTWISDKTFDMINEKNNAKTKVQRTEVRGTENAKKRQIKASGSYVW